MTFAKSGEKVKKSRIKIPLKLLEELKFSIKKSVIFGLSISAQLRGERRGTLPIPIVALKKFKYKILGTIFHAFHLMLQNRGFQR